MATDQTDTLELIQLSVQLSSSEVAAWRRTRAAVPDRSPEGDFDGYAPFSLEHARVTDTVAPARPQLRRGRPIGAVIAVVVVLIGTVFTIASTTGGR